ncbi:hypothetical protein AAVH_19346 [Aphelenchoides avenae]|nr:hypothetical protein AAVH_19346 [Aphelenchus avenae]
MKQFLVDTVFGEATLLHVIAAFDTTFYYSTLLFSILMTLNRVAIFLWPSVHRTLFAMPNLYRTIAGWWILTVCVTILMNASGCYKTFAINGYYLYHDCRTPLSKTVYSVLYVFTTYAPVAMILAYGAIFAYLRGLTTAQASMSGNYGDETNRKRRQEQRLLFQSFLICGSLEIQNLAFNFLPMLGLTGQWEFVVNFVANWISIANNTMTPIVMFTFNRDVQMRLREMLGMGTRKIVQDATTISVVPSSTTATTSARSSVVNLR